MEVPSNKPDTKSNSKPSTKRSDQDKCGFHFFKEGGNWFILNQDQTIGPFTEIVEVSVEQRRVTERVLSGEQMDSALSPYRKKVVRAKGVRQESGLVEEVA